MASNAFLFKKPFSFFYSKPLQLRQDCNLPAPAFVLAFQKAGEQCESFLISPWANEIPSKSGESAVPQPKWQKSGVRPLITEQQNWAKPVFCAIQMSFYFLSPCKCWHIHMLLNHAFTFLPMCYYSAWLRSVEIVGI